MGSSSDPEQRLTLCDHRSPPPPPPPQGTPPLRCDSEPSRVQDTALLIVGVPSSPTVKGQARRDAIRTSWMRQASVGREVVVCFLLSNYTPQPALGRLIEERQRHGDMLLVDAPETPYLIHNATKYTGYRKRGRGMPTFKQHRFFELAAATWPRVAFVAKVDDDTAPNMRLMVPFLRRLQCGAAESFLFIAAINWAGYVPKAYSAGVRGDRCGFAWNMRGALSNFGRAWGTPGVQSGASKYIAACDSRGAALPVPYGTGAGYIFSAALLRWLATSKRVSKWVEEARGPTREALQWQKYEDTTTGYWLSYAPRTVQYVDIGTLVHDIGCHPQGTVQREGESLYRWPDRRAPPPRP